MNAKKLSISFFAIIFVLFTVFSFVSYDISESVSIICFEGSYAHKYAEENNMEFELISDSDAYMSNLSLENFEYNLSKGKGEIVSYTGDSETIAIPTEIDGYTVTKICKNAFKDAENLETIYIPKSVKTLEIENLEDVTVYVYKKTALYKSLSKNKKVKFDLKAMPDSHYVNFYSANIPFSYNNISDNEIEINRYNAQETLVIVPESINGKTVSAISFDALELGIEKLVIPESVKEIKTDLYTNRYDGAFVIGLLLALIATIVSCVFVGTLKIDTKEKMFLTIPQVLIAFVSAILGFVVSGLYLFNPIVSRPILIVAFCVVYGVSAIIVLSSKTAAKAVSKVDEKVKTQTFFIKALTVDADTLVSQAKSAEIKAEVTKVYEAIRYSDPMSNDALTGAETQITLKFNQLQDAVAQNEPEAVKTLANELLILIKDRNNKCKLLK